MPLKNRAAARPSGGNMAKRAVLAAIGCLLTVTFAHPCEARVVRFIVEQTRSFAGGTSFGDVGTYQRLDGTAYMEGDPRDPLDAVIVNLDKAPRNARGLGGVSGPFFILKPTDPTRGNHKILYGINNRGNKQTLGDVNYVPAGAGVNNPLTAADAGDGFLMRLGYTIVDAGWQGDVANLPGSNVLFPNLPIAMQADGSPIIAAVRVECSDRTIPANGPFPLPLEASPSFRSSPAADTNTAHSILAVRNEVSDQGPMTPIAA